MFKVKKYEGNGEYKQSIVADTKELEDGTIMFLMYAENENYIKEWVWVNSKGWEPDVTEY